MQYPRAPPQRPAGKRLCSPLLTEWGCLSACWAQGFSGGAGVSCSDSPYQVPWMEQGRAKLWPHLKPDLVSVPTPAPCCPWVAPGCGSSRHLHESPWWCIRKVSAPTGWIRVTSQSRWRGNWSEWPGEFWAQNSTSEPTGRSRGHCSRKCWTPRGAAEARRVNTLGTHLTAASKGQAWDFGASGAA